MSGLDFQTVYQLYLTYIWNTLKRLGIGDADLEDVAHDVFVVVCRQLPRYDPARPIKPWLFGIAFRVVLGKKRHKAHAHTSEELTVDPADDGISVFDRVLEREMLEVAKAAIEQLDFERRAVFLMHEVEDFTMPQIAAELMIPLNTAYSRLRLARRDVGRYLEQCMPELATKPVTQ